ncbi:unnamed protein product [Boreogadus saida]
MQSRLKTKPACHKTFPKASAACVLRASLPPLPPSPSPAEERVRQYFLSLLSAPAPRSCLATVPAGLTPVRPELASLAGRFMALVDFNRRVYGPFYSLVLKKLMFDDMPPQTPSAAPPTVAAPTMETPSQTAASPS